MLEYELSVVLVAVIFQEQVIVPLRLLIVFPLLHRVLHLLIRQLVLVSRLFASLGRLGSQDERF